ncbi:MAG: hypothetical protein OEL53_10685 [Rhodospirillales bacterium]|nr:hypothetical protein [Rhodospirillales bacterium]
MTDVENLVLEHLRAIRADVGVLREDTREVKLRLNELQASTAGMRRDQALDAETSAHLQAQFDRLREDVDRIKRRLDLAEA